jgi:hypothetical protein
MSRLPLKLHWPTIPQEFTEQMHIYLMRFQNQAEQYLRYLQEDLDIISNEDVWLEERYSPVDSVFYDKDGKLRFYVNGVQVCWFDWSGNWYRGGNFDNRTVNLSKTNTLQLAAFDNQTGTIDIFHDGEQVIQFSETEITIDNQFAVLTGQSLDSSSSLNWIDQGINADGDLTTFLCAREHRVLEIVGTDVRLKGAIKVA